MRCNILCCLLKSGFDIPNSHCCWGDNWEWMSNPTRAHAWKMRTNRSLKLGEHKASLGAQWIRIQLSMQETRVQSKVWKDPTRRGATEPVHCSPRASSAEPKRHNLGSLGTLKPVLSTERSPQWKACRWQLESSPHSLQLEGPTQPKINKYIYFRNSSIQVASYKKKKIRQHKHCLVEGRRGGCANLGQIMRVGSYWRLLRERETMTEDFVSDSAVFWKVQTKPTATGSRLDWTRLLKKKATEKHQNKWEPMFLKKNQKCSRTVLYMKKVFTQKMDTEQYEPITQRKKEWARKKPEKNPAGDHHWDYRQCKLCACKRVSLLIFKKMSDSN